ncbi:MAG TPA: serine hydrolase [Solirubrobacteraceae bacterium]|nr:serine hydrolase [Solirubrobacteraceae bacterium]
MRRLAGVALIAALWPAAARAEQWRPDIAGAARYAHARHGSITFAVRTDERLRGRGLDRQVPAASVFKAMLLTTYLRQASVRHRDLTGADTALLAPMIRRSDNVAATRVRDIVGSAAILRLARRAGMTRFAIAQIWGLSRITARDQTRYFLHIDALMPKRHRAYGMHLLRTITPSQRWGMGRVIPDGWRLYFKGGWGSGTGAVDHQVGLLRRGPYRVAVAILTVDDGSHAYGKATLRGMARRLFKGLGGRLVGTAVEAGGSVQKRR